MTTTSQKEVPRNCMMRKAAAPISGGERTAPIPPVAIRPAAMSGEYPAFERIGHMIGETDMVVATPLPWGPPNRADVITAPRPALDDFRPIVARERSSQKPPAPATSMKVP